MKNILTACGAKIGNGLPCFIIAEAGVNHNGNLDTALELVDLAKSAGADAVKFQTFRAEKLVSSNAPQADYQRKNIGLAETQLDMLKKLELSRKNHEALARHCRKKKIIFMSTPFDEDSADFLESLGMELFKIPSGEITNIGLVKHVARKRKPVIMSTGMSELAEIELAVSTVRKYHGRLALLHCVSSYPAGDSDINLKVMHSLGKTFDCLVGYSDHSIGIPIPLAAAALGACIIEKHFTLDRKMSGPDHKISLEPQDLKDMIDGIRRIENALGDGKKKICGSEKEIMKCARKSIVAASDIEAGSAITSSMLAIKRPGTGIAPYRINELIGKRARRAIKKDQLIEERFLAG